MKLLFKNIKELVQVREGNIQKVSGEEMKQLPTIIDAWLLVEDGIISDYGEMNALPSFTGIAQVDVSNKIILPTWCDSHTHIVYAGNREGEFVDRINGLTYEEIANRGGGILNSAKTLQDTSEADLFEQSAKRLEAVIIQGTGAIEIKSGYGLTMEAEQKMLRVIKKLGENYQIPVKATFLGAHAIPKEFTTSKDYIDHVIKEILPVVAEQELAEFIDVFCEKDYFSVEDTDKLLGEARKLGLVPKIHVNQFNAIGGVAVGVKNSALSVDHLEIMKPEDIAVLLGSETMPVALPGCSLFLSIPYTPARAIIDAGLPLALATDYNPGSAPSGNMNLVVSLACIKMGMTPEEAINAATINGAYAMGLSNSHGSITMGKAANFILTKEIPSYSFIPYSFGSNLIDQVYINGNLVKDGRN